MSRKRWGENTRAISNSDIEAMEDYIRLTHHCNLIVKISFPGNFGARTLSVVAVAWRAAGDGRRWEYMRALYKSPFPEGIPVAVAIWRCLLDLSMQCDGGNWHVGTTEWIDQAT